MDVEDPEGRGQIHFHFLSYWLNSNEPHAPHHADRSAPLVT